MEDADSCAESGHAADSVRLRQTRSLPFARRRCARGAGAVWALLPVGYTGPSRRPAGPARAAPGVRSGHGTGAPHGATYPATYPS